MTVDGDHDLATAVGVSATLSGCGTAVVLSGSVLDAAARTLSVDLWSWLPTAAPGRWSIVYRVAFADGSSITFPRRGQPNTVAVR